MSRPFSCNSASSLKKLGTWKTTPEPMTLTHRGFTRPEGRRWKLPETCGQHGASRRGLDASHGTCTRRRLLCVVGHQSAMPCPMPVPADSHDGVSRIVAALVPVSAVRRGLHPRAVQLTAARAQSCTSGQRMSVSFPLPSSPAQGRQSHRAAACAREYRHEQARGTHPTGSPG